MPKLDLKAAGRRPTVEADNYELVVTGQKHDKVKSGQYQGTDRVNLEFTIEDGDHKGRKVYKSYMLHDDFLYIFKGDMYILDVDEKLLEDEDADSEEIAKAALGARCVGEISVQEYEDRNGETQSSNRVERIHELGWA